MQTDRDKKRKRYTNEQLFGTWRQFGSETVRERDSKRRTESEISK